MLYVFDLSATQLDTSAVSADSLNTLRNKLSIRLDNFINYQIKIQHLHRLNAIPNK